MDSNEKRRSRRSGTPTRNLNYFLHEQYRPRMEAESGMATKVSSGPAVFRAATIPVEEDIVVNSDNSSTFPGDES